MNYIERTRQAIQDREQEKIEIEAGCMEIFITAIDVLSLKGKQGYWISPRCFEVNLK